MLKAAYYLHFVLWRVCRASKDVAFGEFRVQVLLMMIEVNFVSGFLLLIMERQIINLSLATFLVATVAPLLALNVYLLWNPKKWEKYEREFAAYPQRRRHGLDAIAVVVSFAAIFFPVIAHLLKRAYS